MLAGYFRTSKHFEKLVDIFPDVLARVPNAVLLIACRLRIAEHNEKREQLLRMMRFLDNKEHIRILKGYFAPGGSVAKITGKEGLTFKGPARVYDCEEDMMAGLENKEIQKGDVIVIRYEGPKGGPGMPEMLTPTSAIMGAGLGSDVAMITGCRFSGGSHGFIIGHVVPEAQ
ncbi:MAG: dihydroxy-acid dehydratase [Bacteroidales bacterium]|nr:dihydroxy-acid dehydratase [Bacteroidales bacterium]